jgi:hypothetical protein
MLLPALALGGCSSMEQTFGIGKRSPDEFTVVRRAPLVVPPDATLRPPDPGAPPTAEVPTSVAAREVLLGSGAASVPASDATQSAAEKAIVGDAKVTALPNIRTVITQENSQLAVLDRGTFLAILGFQERRQQPQPNVINPVAESRRLAASGVVSTTRTGTTLLTPPTGG